MNKKQVFATSFFIGGTFFLGFGYSLLCSIVGHDAWISVILGVLVGIGIIFLLEQIKKKERTGIKKYKLLNKIIFFLFNVFLFTQIIFIFQTFASSFFLIKSANWFITLPVPFIIYKIATSGIKTIGRISEILFPLASVLLLFTFMGLLQHFEFDSFTPILTNPIENILKGTLLVTAYSTLPYFLFLNIPMEDTKLIKNYLCCELIVFLICIFIIGILGPNLINIYRYPEYMILKEIKLFDFVEKVENISSIAWLFNLFVLLSLAGYNIKESLPKKKNNLFLIIILGLIYFGVLIESYFYPQDLILYHNLPYIFLIIESILIILSFISYHKKKKH